MELNLDKEIRDIQRSLVYDLKEGGMYGAFVDGLRSNLISRGIDDTYLTDDEVIFDHIKRCGKTSIVRSVLFYAQENPTKWQELDLEFRSLYDGIKAQEQIELNEYELRIADAISRLFKSGHIKIGVNVQPEYAEKGDGKWNITQSYAIIDSEYIKLEDGNVEIIDSF
jgi:hypothetical protein